MSTATPDRVVPAAQQAPARSAAVRRAIIMGLAAAAFSCLFVLSFGYAQHAPHAHGVRVSVVAPPAVERRVAAALQHTPAGTFTVHRVDSEAGARNELRRMDTDGALVLVTGKPARILTAGAAGGPLQQLVNKVLTKVALSQGGDSTFVDVVPLPAADRAGLSGFVLELGLLVPALIAATVLFLTGRRGGVAPRVVGALGYAVVAGGLAACVLDAAFGALTGVPWTLFGDAMLIAAVFVFSVTALQSLFGLPGTVIAAGALVVFGNAVNGTAVPTPMLPGAYREIAPYVPNNAAVRLVRSHLYFDGHGLGSAAATLVVWLAASLAVIAVDATMNRRAAVRATRRHQPQPAPMPLVARLRVSRNRRP